MLAEVVPIDFARSGVEGIVDVSLFGPGFEVKQHLLIREDLVYRRFLAKRRPDGDSDMGIHAMYLVNHPLRIPVGRVAKLRRVPTVVISTPVLPVLNHAIHRNLHLPILFEHVQQLLRTHTPPE